MRFRLATLAAVAGGLALATGPLMATSASAVTPDSVVAVVTGNVNNITPQPQNCTPLPQCLAVGSAAFVGEFDQVAISGVFTEQDTPFAGQVTVDPVHISGTQNLVTGSGGIDSTFGTPGFTGAGISGHLDSLNFVRVGTLALANVGLDWTIAPHNSATNVSAVAVVLATPNPTNLSSQFADGIVVGTSAVTPPPV